MLSVGRTTSTKAQKCLLFAKQLLCFDKTYCVSLGQCMSPVHVNQTCNKSNRFLFTIHPQTSQVHQSESAKVAISDSASDFDFDALPPMPPPPPPPSLVSLAQLVIKSSCINLHALYSWYCVACVRFYFWKQNSAKGLCSP